MTTTHSQSPDSPSIHSALPPAISTSSTVTATEAAIILGISTSRVRQLKQDGTIPAVAIHAINSRINLYDLDAIIRLAKLRGREVPRHLIARLD